jgi:hypothetical protein
MCYTSAMNCIENGLGMDDFESAAQPPVNMREWLHQVGIIIPRLFRHHTEGELFTVDDQQALQHQEEIPVEL